MRLTLRTLLAYRDGVLNDSDRITLSNKLRESATARGISDRIDESLRNPKLAPIPVDAKDPWFDANQISEYLDDTSSTETVAEVERRCLENNALLSEVGSCHSILSRALVETVEIPETLKSRIRSLPTDPQLGQTELRIERATNTTSIPDEERLDSPDVNSPGISTKDSPRDDIRQSDESSHPSTASSSAGASPASSNPLLAGKGLQTARLDAPTSSATPRGKTETLAVSKGIDARPEPRGRGIELDDGLGSQVPEYLRGTDRGRLKPILAVALLLVGIVITGTLALGSLETVGRMLAPSHLAKSNGGGANGTLLDSKQPTESSSQRSTASSSTNATTNRNGNLTRDDQPQISATPFQSDLPKTGRGQSTDATSSALSTETVVGKPALNDDGTIAVAESSDSQANRSETEPLSAASGSEVGITWIATDESNKQNLVFVSRNAEIVSPDSNPKWQLAEPNQKLSNTTWVFPFAHRSEIELSTGLKAIICGETELSSSTDETLVMPYGRMLLFPSPDLESTRIKLPLGIIEISFNAVDSSCAIEVGTRIKKWDWMPGTNPPETLDNQTLHLESFIDVIGIQGDMSCKLIESSATTPEESPLTDAMSFSVGDVVRVTKSSIEKDALLNAPSWLKSNTERAIDNLAIKDLQKALKASPEIKTEPIAALMEQAGSRKPETASMASRLLFQLGNFDHFLGADGILRKRSNFAHTSIWLDKIPDFLYSSERVAAFQKSLQIQTGESYATICRLLFPMTNDQLAEGGDKYLVDELASSELPNRILAIQQLTGITRSNLGYHPDRTNVEATGSWSKLQSEGAIRHAAGDL